MKLSKIIVPAAFVAAIWGAVVINNLFAQDVPKRQARATTVAVCNVFNVLKNCQETKDRTANTLAIEASVKAEMQKRIAQVNALKAEMEGLDPNSKEYDNRMDEIERLSLDAETWHKLTSSKVIRQEIKAHVAMYEKLQEAIRQIASENGIDIVLFQSEFDMPENPTIQEVSGRMRERIVVYNNDQVDISDAVLVRFNELYKSAKDKE